MGKYADWSVLLSSNDNQLFCEHDGFVRQTYSYVNTDERKKRTFNSRLAAWWSDISGLLLQDERPRRSQGRQEPAAVSRRCRMRAKQSGTDNEKEPEKLHILT